MQYVELTVIGILAIHSLVLLYQNNELVNKIMSRDYHSYQMSQNVGKIDQPKPSRAAEDMPEDLNAIF